MEVSYISPNNWSNFQKVVNKAAASAAQLATRFDAYSRTTASSQLCQHKQKLYIAY